MVKLVLKKKKKNLINPLFVIERRFARLPTLASSFQNAFYGIITRWRRPINPG